MQSLELLVRDLIDKNNKGEPITEDLEFLLLAVQRQNIQHNVGRRISVETLKVFKKVIYEQNFGSVKGVRSMEITRKVRDIAIKQLNLPWDKVPWSMQFFHKLFKDKEKEIIENFEIALEKERRKI